MSINLVKLAVECAPFLGADGDPDGAAAMRELLGRYRDAARGDSARALADEREARDRLFGAVQLRVEASRAALEAPVRRAQAFVTAARESMEDAATRAAEADLDLAYAVERAGREERTRCLRPDLGAHALRQFAIERLRQLEEIAAPLGAAKVERHAVLVDELRRRFNALAATEKRS